MSSLGNQISYYLSIAIEISKKLGSKRGYYEESNKNKSLIGKNNVKKQRYQIISKIKEKHQKVASDVLGNSSEDRQKNSHLQQNKTLTQARQLLLGDHRKKQQLYAKNSKTTEIQLPALQRFQMNDEIIEIKLGQLANKTVQWKDRVKVLGKLVTQSVGKIDDISIDVDQVNDKFVHSNKKLKGIIEQYRKPHKFLIDIILILMLIGLIVGIIKVAQK